MGNPADAIVCYTCTNERLEAIVRGMDLKNEDTVLAVGGSGDQAFAIQEYAAGVGVVDSKSAQCQYILQRIAVLEKGSFRQLLRLDPFEEGESPYSFYDKIYPPRDINSTNKKIRDAYFRQGRRLQRLRAKAARMEVYPPGDIFEVAAREGRFNKIYLSNAVRYERLVESAQVESLLHSTAANLPIGGLIYISNFDTMLARFTDDPFFREIFNIGRMEYFDYSEEYFRRNENRAPFLPEELSLDWGLTRIALDREQSWRPGVLRKTG